jgi:hypothetical protein
MGTGAVVLAVVALIVAFLAEPAMQAGRAASKHFRRIWENTDEDTDIQG